MQVRKDAVDDASIRRSLEKESDLDLGNAGDGDSGENERGTEDSELRRSPGIVNSCRKKTYILILVI